MKVGVFLYATDLGWPPIEIARAAENRGIESLFLCEHSHVPAPPEVYRDPAGRALPEYYSRLHDPLISLAAMAVATSTLILGTAVCVIAQRDPVTTAKEVATLDHAAGGRLELGVGAGWSDAELRGHGVAPADRFPTFARNLATMRSLWTSDSVTLAGDPGAPIAMWPRPLQRPHPPVLVGGNGPHVLHRVEALGDGWLMTGSHPDLGGALTGLRALEERLGRHLPTTVVGLAGEADELDRYADLGINRVLLTVRPGPREAIEKRLDRIAQEGVERSHAA